MQVSRKRGSNAIAPAWNVPGFGEYEYGAQTLKPFTTLIPEMFKIGNGKIVQIEATMASIPYGSKSRWEDRT